MPQASVFLPGRANLRPDQRHTRLAEELDGSPNAIVKSPMGELGTTAFAAVRKGDVCTINPNEVFKLFFALPLDST